MTPAKLERLRALLDAWEGGALRDGEEGELRGLVREAVAELDDAEAGCTWTRRRCDGEGYCRMHNPGGRLD